MSCLRLLLNYFFANNLAIKEECLVKCHELAALINFQGLEKPITVIGDTDSRFVWKDSYVSMIDLKGTCWLIYLKSS